MTSTSVRLGIVVKRNHRHCVSDGLPPHDHEYPRDQISLTLDMERTQSCVRKRIYPFYGISKSRSKIGALSSVQAGDADHTEDVEIRGDR